MDKALKSAIRKRDHMYDLLFQNQTRLSEEDLFNYAGQTGLNMTSFRRDIQSQALASKIEADIESGLKSEVSGTPSFYINGEKLEDDCENGGLIQYLKSLLQAPAIA